MEYSNNSYSTLSEELPRNLKKLYLQNKIADALTEAGYDSKRIDQWGYGAEMEKDGLTFSNKSPVGFYSLAETAAKKLNRTKGTGQEFINELKKAGVTEDELNWTGFMDKFSGPSKITKNEVTKFLKNNRLDVKESVVDDEYSPYTLRGDSTRDYNYRTVLLTLPKNKETPAGPYISREHYDVDDYEREEVENLLVHLRFSDYNRMNSKNLILEEYQSDVHMQGEKEKYIADPFESTSKELIGTRINEMENEVDLLEDSQQDLLEYFYDLDETTVLPFDKEDLDVFNLKNNTNLKNADDIEKLMQDYETQTQNLYKDLQSLQVGVPDMPFKRKRSGKGWQELGVKRILIEAAKGDYDNLIIPTGQEQLNRYSDVFNSPENPTEKKFKKDPTAMLRSYDVVLPGILNKFGKKYNKKVEDVNSDYVRTFSQIDFNEYEVDDTIPEPNVIRLFSLTPEMKADILRGLPQFYAGGLMKRKAYKEGGKVLNTLRRARN